ncbi:DUF4238 domain-containing protein [Kitasatospora cineracea]
MNEGTPAQWLAEAKRMEHRIEELRPEADRRVLRQHLISRVLLKRFSAPNGSRGHQLVPFDLDNPGRLHKATGVGACGTMHNFAHYASASLEQVWSRLESQIPKVAQAVDDGSVFSDPQHVKVLKDLIALHLVRSLHYRAVHENVFAQVYTEHRIELLTSKADLLRAAVLERSGLHLAGPQGLMAAADQILRPHLDNFVNGADFRVRIEETFEKAKELIGSGGLEILLASEGEYLLGDTPALTISQEEGKCTYHMAIGDSTAIVLPFGPKHLLVGRTPRNGFDAATPQTVDYLNRLQIEAAQRRVYFRPRSGLDRFVRTYLAQGGRANGQ